MDEIESASSFTTSSGSSSAKNAEHPPVKIAPIDDSPSRKQKNDFHVNLMHKSTTAVENHQRNNQTLMVSKYLSPPTKLNLEVPLSSSSQRSKELFLRDKHGFFRLHNPTVFSHKAFGERIIPPWSSTGIKAKQRIVSARAKPTSAK